VSVRRVSGDLWLASKQGSSSARTSTRAGFRIRAQLKVSGTPSAAQPPGTAASTAPSEGLAPHTKDASRAAEGEKARRVTAQAHQVSAHIARAGRSHSSDELPVVVPRVPDRHPGRADEGRQQRAREHYPCGIDVAVQAFLTVNGLVVGPRRRLRPGGFAGGRVAQLGASVVANGHRHPATPSPTQPHNASSIGPCSRVRHYPATVCDRLILIQVHRIPFPGLLTPRHRRRRHHRSGRRRDQRKPGDLSRQHPRARLRRAATAAAASARLAQGFL